MLVQGQEFLKYIGMPEASTEQVDEAERVLSGVQSDLELYCHRPLELVQVREVVKTDSMGYANVSITPVLKVISTTSAEVMYAPSPLNLYSPIIPAPMERDALLGAEGLAYALLQDGVEYGNPLTVPGGILIGVPDAIFMIEYVGGMNLDENRWELDSVKTAIKRVAAREFSMMQDDTLSLRGDNAEKASEQDNNKGKGWTDDELKKFDRLRRRIVAR